MLSEFSVVGYIFMISHTHDACMVVTVDIHIPGR